MDPIFCKAMLGVADAVVSADACAGATAAIRAAEIQADAARYAGELTLFAGIGALMAGILTYWSQIRSANIQVKYQYQQEVFKQNALLIQYEIKVLRIYAELSGVFRAFIIYNNNLEQIDFRKLLVVMYTLLESPPSIDWSRIESPEDISKLVSRFYIDLQSVALLTDEVVSMISCRKFHEDMQKPLENSVVSAKRVVNEAMVTYKLLESAFVKELKWK